MSKNNQLRAVDRELVTSTGIVIPDPDQGIRHLSICLNQGQIDVWEPFDDDTEGGHNLDGFLERWDDWVKSDLPYFRVVEPRFGAPAIIPRSTIESVRFITISIRRREDTRAAHRASLAKPQTRIKSDGSIEVLVPNTAWPRL